MNTELSQSLQQAVREIKQTILVGQYHAAKHVNRVQLVTYYSIGKYISQHSRQGKWGTNAIQTISEQLLRELPGLRGFSANSLKNMRKFYERWQMLDNNSTIMSVELAKVNSTIAIVDFPIEDFFSVPFTHHIRIYNLYGLTESAKSIIRYTNVMANWRIGDLAISPTTTFPIHRSWVIGYLGNSPSYIAFGGVKHKKVSEKFA